MFLIVISIILVTVLIILYLNDPLKNRPKNQEERSIEYEYDVKTYANAEHWDYKLPIFRPFLNIYVLCRKFFYSKASEKLIAIFTLISAVYTIASYYKSETLQPDCNVILLVE